MSENMRKFLETISKDNELAAKVCKMEKEGLVALAKELGIALTDADFAAPVCELGDDELDAVAGGGGCYCALGGGGKADSNDKACACVAAGVGQMKVSGTGVGGGTVRCYCVAGGYGADS